MPSHVAAIAALAPSSAARRRITDAEVREIIRAYRRHVPVAQIARTLGRTPASLYTAVGAWALREARVEE